MLLDLDDPEILDVTSDPHEKDQTSQKIPKIKIVNGSIITREPSKTRQKDASNKESMVSFVNKEVLETKKEIQDKALDEQNQRKSPRKRTIINYNYSRPKEKMLIKKGPITGQPQIRPREFAKNAQFAGKNDAGSSKTIVLDVNHFGATSSFGSTTSNLQGEDFNKSIE